MPTAIVNGVELYYEVHGEVIPVLFIHPPLLNGVSFVYQMKGLSDACQIITFDLRGHGRSSPSPEPLDYRLVADDIKGLVDHLRIEKLMVCGYSTGASIALEFLLRYPEHALGGILISGMSEVTDWRLKAMISLAVRLSRPKPFWSLALSICFSNADNSRLFLRMLRQAQKDDVDNVQQYYRYSLYYSCTSQLHRIDKPMLLICGTKDKRFVHYSYTMLQKLPQSKLVFIQGAKHQIPTKWSRQANMVMREFIRECQRTGLDSYAKV